MNHDHDHDLVVSGGSYAALATAWFAAQAGRTTHLLLPDRRNAGSGFAPLDHGQPLERGARLLELDYGDGETDAEGPPLARYEPAVGAHRPYQALVREFLFELLGDALVETTRPAVFVNGRWCDDWYFTTDLTGLRHALTDLQAHAIASQVRAADGAGILRPGAANLDALSLADASRRNHGGVYHELAVESICRKVLAGGSAGVAATLRRKVWMPLFWPATLADAVRGRPLAFAPDRRFHTVRPRGTGEVVTRLLERLDASRLVDIEEVGPLQALKHAGVSASGTTMTRLDYEGRTIEAAEPVLGHPAEELFRAVGADHRPERVRAVLCWIAVPSEHLLHDPSVVTVADPAVPAFRISGADGADGRRILCLELAHDVGRDEIVDAARATMGALGMTAQGAPIEVLHQAVVPSFVAPSFANRSAFAAAEAVLRERLPGARVVGGGAAFGADALNEQIVQARHAVEVTRACR